MLAELVPWLRRYRELDLDDAAAGLLVGMSAATIDRKLAGPRSSICSGAGRTPSRGRC